MLRRLCSDMLILTAPSYGNKSTAGKSAGLIYLEEFLLFIGDKCRRPLRRAFGAELTFSGGMLL